MPIKNFDEGVETAIPAPAVMVRKEKSPPKLLQRDFMQAEFAYAKMSATLPVGHTFKDALRPEYWVNVAYMLAATPVTNEPDRAGAVIEVRTADHSFYAELYVRGVPEQGLIVSVLREPVYFGPKQDGTPQFDLRWNLGKRGFDVLRKSDGAIVGDGTKFPTKEMALKWVEDTVAAMRVQ